MCLNSERAYRRAKGAPETCLQSQSPIAEVLASRVFHLNPNAIASTVFDPSSQLQVTTTVALSVRRACLLAPGLQFVHYLPYLVRDQGVGGSNPLSPTI